MSSVEDIRLTDQLSMVIECPVCLAEFSRHDNRLRLLACSHEICIGCVNKLEKCPLCNETLNIVDLENADFLNRRGFDCATCTTKRTSDKMRVCLTCSENKGILVKQEKLNECSSIIFCFECIFQDHIEKGHRQEQLVNYDLEYMTIKEMQRTCLVIKPVLHKITFALDDIAEKYQNLGKAIELVLSPQVDVHYTHLQDACSVLHKCLGAITDESEMQRKLVTHWNDLEKSLNEDIAQEIRQHSEELRTQKTDFETKIQKQQEEIENLQLELKGKIRQNSEEQRRDDLSKENERKKDLLGRMDVFLKRQEAEELRREQESRKVQQQENGRRTREQQMQAGIRKITEAMSDEKKDDKLMIRLDKFLQLHEAVQLELKNKEKLKKALENPVSMNRLLHFHSRKTWLVGPSSINCLNMSVTKSMFLCSCTLLCSRSETDAAYTIRITGPNDSESCVDAPAWSKGQQTRRVRFPEPFQMDPGCKYLLECTVDKEFDSECAAGGTSFHEIDAHPGYGVEFSNHEGSKTTVSEGQFAYFYFAPIP